MLRIVMASVATITLASVGCKPKVEAPIVATQSPVAARSPSARQEMLTGRVLHDDAPVEGATVRHKATAIATTTDEHGNFRLEPLASSPDDSRVTVSKPGYVIVGFDANELPSEINLATIPADNSTYSWVDPRPDDTEIHNCGNCHREIFEQWNSGSHATSATGRQFLEMYSSPRTQHAHPHDWSLADEYPEGLGVCASCHAPAAALDELGIGDIRGITGVARHGVHCDFCHKISEVELPALGLTHGRFAMKLARPADDQFFFGPLDDVDRGEDSHLPMQSESRFCAPCHEGTVFGTPVYTTFSEWLASPAARSGKQCQSCHMAPDGIMTNIAPGSGGVERTPHSLASHSLMPGGRLAMLRRAIKLVVEPKRNPDAHVRVTLTADDVGHRVPTGFIDRHLILVVAGENAQGNALPLAVGPRLGPSTGKLATSAGVVFAKRLLTNDNPHPVPFWRAGAQVIDNRLIPQQPQEYSFGFGPSLARVHVKLLYRKFWTNVEKAKKWNDSTIVVYEQTVEIEATD